MATTVPFPPHEIATRAQLRDGVPLRAQAGDTLVPLVRDGDAVHAFQTDCPHADAPLERGAVCGGCLICPWHKAMFDVRSGARRAPPVLRGLARHRVATGSPARQAFVTCCGQNGQVAAALGCGRETRPAQAMREPRSADDARRLVLRQDHG